MTYILSAFVLLVALTGCSGTNDDRQSQESDDSASPTEHGVDTERILARTVKRPDILVLSIRDQDSKLLDSEEAMVMADGTVRFTSVGKFTVDGKTLSEVQAMVRGKLGGQVTVEVRILSHGAQ